MKEFSRKLWFLATLLVVIVILATVVNLKSADDTVLKFINSLDIDSSAELINWNNYKTVEIPLSGPVEITSSGTYHLTGNLEDGGVTIKTTKEEPVKLILENATIKNSSGPAISCLEADNLVIELVGENNLVDGETYDAKYDEDIKGAIYSKADLTFEGNGILNLTANFSDGIIGKNDLKIKTGTYNIIAKDDGIRGKDSVYLKNGHLTIISGADAIKSTSELTPGKGFVLIEDGNYYLKSGAKGIKSTINLLIYGGSINLDSYDDAIHSDNNIGITGGDIIITSGDDGIHANRELIIDNGKIDIKRSYEGLEAQIVTINGGQISLLTSDDGINAGAGADLSSLNRPGANKFTKNDEDAILTINGGEIFINASGDGVDSNGYLYFNGGKTIIDGPTNNKNGSLDAGLGITMRGGEVIAIGTSGMAETLGKNSTVYNISIYFNETYPANTKIEIKDDRGALVLEHISAKSFNHLSAGSEKFIPSKIYNLYINDIEYKTFAITNQVTTIDLLEK